MSTHHHPGDSEPTNVAGLFTASWRVALAAEPAVLPVRISVGWPRWVPRPHGGYPVVRGACPYGLLARDLPADEFDRRYLERLDRYADEIARDLDALRTRDRPALLCCFEERPEDCHRSLLSGWWSERTGEQIEEFVPSMAQMTLTEEDA